MNFLIQHLFEDWFVRSFGNEVVVWLMIPIPGLWCWKWTLFCWSQHQVWQALVCGALTAALLSLAAMTDVFSIKQRIAALTIVILYSFIIRPSSIRSTQAFAPTASAASERIS